MNSYGILLLSIILQFRHATRWKNVAIDVITYLSFLSKRKHPSHNLTIYIAIKCALIAYFFSSLPALGYTTWIYDQTICTIQMNCLAFKMIYCCVKLYVRM